MNYKIEVTIDVISHATEDFTKFLVMFEKLFGIKEDKFLIQNLKGHFDNPIVILHTKLVKNEAKTFVEKIIHSDGSVRWRSTTKVPFVGGATDERAVLGIAIDITERRHAEEQLRKSEKLASIGTLVASVAHEVRNPLFALSATLDAAEVRATHPLGEYLTPLREQVDRLSQLMEELLEYGEPHEPLLSASSISLLPKTICRPSVNAMRIGDTMGTESKTHSAL